MRPLLIILSILVSATFVQATDVGDFRLELDPDNALLPASLSWKGVELLNPKMTLNFTFTDFMYRTKYYREENTGVWEGKEDPRFVTDVKLKSETARVSEQDGFRVWTVDYDSSYASVTRYIMLQPEENRVRIVYDLTFLADTMIHEPIYFGPQIRLGASFTTHSVPQVGAEAFTVFSVPGYAGGQVSCTPLNAGPRLVQAPESKTAMLISYAWSRDVPDPVLTRQWQATKGQSLRVAIDLRLAADPAALLPEMQRQAEAMSDRQTAFLMYTNAELLIKLGKVPEAEAMLLKSAETDTTYSAPFALLANLRANPASESTMTAQEAFTYASYRQPYNYGWSLSGAGFPSDKRLTEEERRLAIFNLLISVENCQFYSEYYLWVARHFQEMKMYAQAAAMTRQAIWALDRMPRPEAYREKERRKMQKMLDALEKHLIDDPTAILPPLIEIDLRGRE